MIQSFLSLPLSVQLSLIALITTILSAVISSLLSHLFYKKSFDRERRIRNLDAAKKYANPILDSSISLSYRLREILSSRHKFLLDNSAQNKFNQYKLISTFYRFCALLGWLRAYKKEHTFFDISNKNQSEKFDTVIAKFQGFIADGHDIETFRVKGLSKLFWDVELEDILTIEKIKKLGFDTENLIHRYLIDDGKEFSLVTEIPKEKQKKLLKELLDLINNELKNENISAKKISEKLVVASQTISILSTMIYRDWQSAIGEFMLIEVSHAPIRFEVISYNKFEEYFKAEFTEEEREWMIRVFRLFKNLDIDIDDKFDMRKTQLIKIYSGLIEIIKVLSEMDKNLKKISMSHIKEFEDHLNQIKNK